MVGGPPIYYPQQQTIILPNGYYQSVPVTQAPYPPVGQPMVQRPAVAPGKPLVARGLTPDVPAKPRTALPVLPPPDQIGIAPTAPTPEQLGIAVATAKSPVAKSELRLSAGPVEKMLDSRSR